MQGEVDHLTLLDECPFSKPSRGDFETCPAYRAMDVVTFDPSYEPLAWFKACRHLELKATTPIENRWYGACAIGDAAARDRWTQSIGA